MLSIFELFLIMFQLSSSRITIPPKAPDLSAQKAKADFVLFMPGCVPGALLFLVFGTTALFREHMRKTFLPRRFHKTKPRDAQLRITPYSSQNGKSFQPSTLTDDGPSTATDEGAIIQLREVDQRKSMRKEEDEWPILTTTTRVNGAMV